MATEKRIAMNAPPVGTDSAAPTEKKSPPPATHDGLSMSEMLDRAGAARRSGDYATARDLFQKVVNQNPGNVEANGGLGDVARAQGDLSSAKASYERALTTSPSYGPAQLGLADTEWDLGNRAGAQRRYAQIVERLGERAPERAKQRGTAAAE
jgi:Tfp pilus assembly protein PilF